ncbi:MAG TPA: nitronate monooxygenase [Solirubrobacteraceae bacterium]|nr:nitronate monooxygenase [Solirubrobacteraceae bacterium]
MLTTPLCDLLGIRVPVIQAPVAASPRLAAAVADAGGFGMLGLTWTPVDQIGALVAQTRQITHGPFGANIVIAEPQHERVDATLAAGVPLVSLFWGEPAPYIDAIHAAGALAAFTVGSAAEARQALDAGVDVIVAQGWEAGGHVWGEVATLALLPAVVDASAPAPVVAAGGIADGRGLAAALALGAVGAWVGTRFVASAEGAFHGYYKQRIVSARETDTVRTTAFGGGWPDAPHRVLRNSTVDRYEHEAPPPAGASDIVARTDDGDPVARYSFMEPTDSMSGDLEALALYAGQGSGLIAEVQSVGEILARMAVAAERSLRTALGGTDARAGDREGHP